MGRQARLIFLIGVVTLGACAVAIALFWPRAEHAVKPEAEDLAKHPVYSGYHFPDGEDVINFGTQPLWAFAGNVLETMRRDHILREELGRMGMEIHLHSFLKGADLNHFTRRGHLDGGILGDMALLAIAAQTEILVPSLTDQGYDEIVAAQPIRLEQLKGKRIGCPMGASTHHAILEALSFHGLSEDQAELVPMDVPEMAQAMSEGRIDACGVWEPMTPVVLQANPGSAVVYRSRYLGFMYFTRAFADKHPQAIRLILAAQVRAIRWMLLDRQNVLRSSRWAAEASAPFGASEGAPYASRHLTDVVVRASGLCRLPTIPTAVLREGGPLHRELEFLKRRGQVPGELEWGSVSRMLNREILTEVLASPARYRLEELQYEGTNQP